MKKLVIPEGSMSIYTHLSELNLSPNVVEVLRCCRITVMLDLVMSTESDLLKIKGIDNDAINEIKELLKKNDHELANK
jgi:DNA-directed RNA polymerase alpha subunit